MNNYFSPPPDLAPETKARSVDINSITQATNSAFDKLPAELALKTGTANYAVDTGTVNAYVATMASAIISYTDGMVVRLRPVNSNTGASTLNVNALGAIAIKRTDGSNPLAGDLQVNVPIELSYVAASNTFVLPPVINSYVKNASDSAAAAASNAAAAASSASSAAGSATASSNSQSAAAQSAQAAANSAAALHLADYAALRAFTGSDSSVYITGYIANAAPSGIAGPFTRDDSDTAVLATPVNSAFAVAGGTLAAATYYYRVSATDAYGETLASAETSIAVPAQLATPVNAAFSIATTGGTLAAATYYYRVSAINAVGETLASAETSIAVPAQLATPVNAAFTTNTAGGSLAAGTYYYRVSAINSIGETLASTETSITTTGTTSIATVTWGAVTGATGYKIYGRTTGTEKLLATVGVVTTWDDNGTLTPTGALPSTNTTSGGAVVNWGVVAGATGYKVYGRATGAELLLATLGAVTTWTDNGSVTPAGALPASNTTSGGVTVNWGAVANATGYKIYGRTTGAELYIATVGAVTSWTDNGSITPAGALPTGYKKDNGATVIEASNGKRWKRTHNGIINADYYPSLAAAVADASGKTLVVNGSYVLDNSAADGLVIAIDNVVITGCGTINCSSIAQSGIKITGKNVILKGITVKGPGAYDTSGSGGAVIPGLIYIDGSGLNGPINCRIENCNVLEPGKMGIVAYKAVGVEIINNRVENSLPVSTWLNTSNNHLIRTYACARFKIAGNRLKGFSEGIVVQAYSAGEYDFNDYDGVASNNKSRKFSVTGNHVTGTYDHAIYICNDNEHYICNDNFLSMASDAEGGEGTCSLKLEGGYFEACGNYAREGIQLRNPYYGRVENNTVVIHTGSGTAHNPSKYGILSQETSYQRDLLGMSVNNNTVVVVGNLEVDAGIRIEGPVWSGFQSKIKDLSVCGNTLVGVGQNSVGRNGFGIAVHQDMPTSGGVVTGSTGEGVTISGNTIDLSTFTGYTGGTGSHGIEVLNIDYATVTGNTIRNFSQRGFNILGLRYSYLGDNTFNGNSASADQKFAAFESGSDTSLHVDSVGNTYGINQARNVSYKYFIADESTVCRDLLPLVNAGAANFDQSLSSYDECELFVWAPTAAGHTLTFATGRPWGIGQKVKVFNHGSVSFTVTNTGTVIAAGSTASFCCTGANTFITYV